MNRYKTGGPSKASATTLCQKCLKRGHYSYECTASKDDRPYVSRPSRSQQLQNPKLAPKLSAVLPEPKPTSKAITSNSGTVRDTSRSRRRSIDLEEPSADKRRRSVSSHSSNSVSTISTNRSKSRSRSRSPPAWYSRRRRSVSPARDYHDREQIGKESRIHPRSMKTSARARSRSPTPDHRPSRYRENNRQRSYSPKQSHQAPPINEKSHYSPNAGTGHTTEVPTTARERSLSPYSQRIALTKAKNQT